MISKEALEIIQIIGVTGSAMFLLISTFYLIKAEIGFRKLFRALKEDKELQKKNMEILRKLT